MTLGKGATGIEYIGESPWMEVKGDDSLTWGQVQKSTCYKLFKRDYLYSLYRVAILVAYNIMCYHVWVKKEGVMRLCGDYTSLLYGGVGQDQSSAWIQCGWLHWWTCPWEKVTLPRSVLKGTWLDMQEAALISDGALIKFSVGSGKFCKRALNYSWLLIFGLGWIIAYKG